MNEVPATGTMKEDKKIPEQASENVSAGSSADGTNTSEAFVADAPEMKDKVLAALKTVYDPEIPVDIYELGLIYEINVYPVNNVYIQMTLTSPSCPSAEAIPSEVQQKIKAIDGVNDVKVDVTFDPPYSQDMMSEAAKLELGFM
jgi:FeS assembly SUF system protein